jgi:CubicO group peptidase (beta-lactamase class C family)
MRYSIGIAVACVLNQLQRGSSMKTNMNNCLGCTVVLLVAPLLLWAEDDASSGAKPIAAALQPFVDRHALAGAVTLVADKDRVLSLEAVGFADIANNTLMGTDALFWIASQSKPITAAALMMLVDEGKVSLDDPVEKYVPEFSDLWVVEERNKERMLLKRPAQRITVRNLLSHTSGLPFASAMERPTLDVLTLRDAARSYAMTPLLFEPGSKYQYSNAGINTAGRIIEVVSGMSYEDFLQKRLFDPLGMKDTTFWPNQQQLRRLAKSYRANKDGSDLEEITVGQLKYPLNDRRRQPMPAGGLFSTARDVGRFCQMMLNGGTFAGKRVVSESAVKEMTRKQTGPGIKEGYGLGWSTGGGSFGHGGAFSTNMTIDTKRGLVFVYMVQHAGFPKDGGRAQGEFRKAAEERFGRMGN